MPYEDNLSVMGNLLGIISQRQQYISDNVANANTPGYVAKDISFSQMLETMKSPFENSLSRKMANSSVVESFSGQPVNLQHEMIEMQRNSLFYNVAIRRTSTIISLLKSSIQVGR